MTSLLTPFGQNAPVLYLKKKAKLLVFFCLSFIVQSNAQTWTQLSPPSVPFAGSILGIHFVSDQTGYACGANGAISKTVDCGKTWVAQPSGTNRALYSIFFTSHLNGVAVGDGGTIRVTTTGGNTWFAPTTVPANAVNTDFRVVWFDTNGANGYIGGGISQSYSQILKTINGGVDWVDRSPAQNFGPGITGRAIYGIFFNDASTGYATDFDGRILKTTTGGLSWTPNQVTSASNNLHGIYFISATVGFAVGGDPTSTTGIILKTENAGGSWIPTNLPAGSFLTDIKFNSSGGAYAVGGNPVTNAQGVIYKPFNITTTGTNSWVLETDVPSSFSRLYRLSLPSATTGYTCGITGTLLKTPFIDATFTISSLINTGCFGFLFNNSGANTLTYSWNFGDPMSGANNTSAQQNPTHQFSKCGTFNVCLTVTGGGCSTTTCQTVTIVDNTPPVIVCPPTYAATCSANTTPAMAGTATATDDCTPRADISITYTDQVSGLADCDQTIRRTWTAKDKCGNTSTCVQLIAVRDNIPPLITNCPRNQTVGTDPGQCFFTITTPWTIIATDNCDPNPSVTLTYTDPSGLVKPFTASTTLPKGNNTFVYVTKDKCGNMSSQCVFTITVKDNEVPKIICPLSVSVIGTLTPPSAQCKAVVKGLAPTVTDNCPMVTVAYAITGATTGSGATDASGTNFMQGISTVTYTATDMGGNTATCSFTVTVFCDTMKCACSPNTKPQPNMVSNGSFSFGNLGFTSGLPFSPACGAGSNYGIGANFTDFCSKWNSLLDNTQGNNTGSFLMIDGSEQSAVNVWESSTAAFVANNTYCFSFYWALAFAHPFQNFTLDINIIDNNGNIVYTVESGIPINTNTTWVHHPKVFTLPSNFPSGTYSIVIRQTSAGAYRDFGIDDICLQEIENLNDTSCLKNLVKNPGFFQGAVAGDLGFGGQSNDWVSGSITPQVAQSDNCFDATSIQMWGSLDQGESICQVNMNFIQGRKYRIKFCGRFYNDPALTTNYIRFGFTAMNNCNNNSPFLCNTPNCENIGSSSQITSTAWLTYQLIDWVPANNWSVLNIRAFNNNNYPNISFGRIDNICIVEVDSLTTSTRDFLSHQIPIRIFPNPNPGKFTVELPQPANPGMTLRVIDLAGRLVLEKTTETGNLQQTIQAGHLSGGMYFLQVVEKGRIVGVEKFVKQ